MIVIVGKEITFYSSFYNGSDIITSDTSPHWEVFDHEDVPILAGEGQIVGTEEDQWSASLTIPDRATLPDSADDLYRIVWTLENDDGIYTSTERFEVRADGLPITRANKVMMESEHFSDVLALSMEAHSVKVELRTEKDVEVLAEVEVEDPKYSNGFYYYEHMSSSRASEATVAKAGVEGLLSIWRVQFEEDGLEQVESHVIFVVNTKVMLYINSMREALDRIRNLDINPNLQWEDVDYLHFMIEGLNYLNAHPPHITEFNLGNLPPEFRSMLLICARYQALEAWHLAEGMATFDFQGGNTTLSTDRTQYIATMKDDAKTMMDESLLRVKKLYSRRRSAGVLGVSLSPTLNRPLLGYGYGYLNSQIAARQGIGRVYGR